MSIKCHRADRVQCSFQCTGASNYKETGTQQGFSVLPSLLLIYYGVLNRTLQLCAPIPWSVNSNHGHPCLKHNWWISLLSIKCFPKKKRKSTFLKRLNQKEESQSSGFWLAAMSHFKAVLSLLKKICLPPSTINSARAARCGQQLGTDFQRTKTEFRKSEPRGIGLKILLIETLAPFIGWFEVEWVMLPKALKNTLVQNLSGLPNAAISSLWEHCAFTATAKTRIYRQHISGW